MAHMMTHDLVHAVPYSLIWQHYLIKGYTSATWLSFSSLNNLSFFLPQDLHVSCSFCL